MGYTKERHLEGAWAATVQSTQSILWLEDYAAERRSARKESLQFLWKKYTNFWRCVRIVLLSPHHWGESVVGNQL